jgi:hypothetical protein
MDEGVNGVARPFPVSKFLIDVGPRKQDTPAPAKRADRSGPEPLQLYAVADKNSQQHRVAAAHARGLEEGRAAADADWQAKRDEQRAVHDKQLALERITWASREADKLAEQLSIGLRTLENTIGDTVAELLKPFLIGAVQQRAIAELMQAIETVLHKDEGVALEISGPEDIVQLLREKLSGKNIALSFVPGDGPEVRIVAGQTVMESQLQSWVSKIEESLR